MVDGKSGKQRTSIQPTPAIEALETHLNGREDGDMSSQLEIVATYPPGRSSVFWTRLQRRRDFRRPDGVVSGCGSGSRRICCGTASPDGRLMLELISVIFSSNLDTSHWPRLRFACRQDRITAGRRMKLLGSMNCSILVDHHPFKYCGTTCGG